MTDAQPTVDLGPSWLSNTLADAVVVDREISECTVTALFDGYFSYRARGRRRRDYMDVGLVAEGERPLVAPGARFWLVSERLRGRPGGVHSALAFRRPGVSTAEQAFAARTGADR
jgi:hypothetical protein